MAWTYIAASDLIMGQGHPYYSDVKNRLGEEIRTAMLVSHDPNGRPLDFPYLPALFEGTYTGTGAAQTVTVTTDTEFNILMVGVFSASYADMWFRSTEMSDTNSTGNYVDPISDGITALSGRTFTVGVNANLNNSGTTYYYWAVGWGGWTESTANVDPTETAHATSMVGDGTGSSMANAVEYHMLNGILQYYDETGASSTNLFAGLAPCEVGTFEPTGSSSQTITLEDSSAVVKGIMIWREDLADGPIFQLAGMSEPKRADGVDLPDTGYITLGTGQFTINGTKLINPETLLTILSNTTDGSTTFTDSSSFSNLVQVSFTATNQPVEHKTTIPNWEVDPVNGPYLLNTYAARSGTTSIRYGETNVSGAENELAAYRSDGYTYLLSGDFEVDFYLAYGSKLSTGVIELYAEDLFGNVVTISIWSKHSSESWDGSAWSRTINLTVRLSGTEVITGSTNIYDAGWVHVELKRESNFLKLYIDSVQQGSNYWYSSDLDLYYIFVGSAGSAADETYHSLLYGLNSISGMDDVYVYRTPKLFEEGYTYHYVTFAAR